MTVPQIENYPIAFDCAVNILKRVGGDDAYVEPMTMVTFANDAQMLHYFLRFSDVIHSYNKLIWTVPQGYGAEQWLAENSPESKIDNDWVWIVFKSSVEKAQFEGVLIPEASDELLAHLVRPLCR